MRDRNKMKMSHDGSFESKNLKLNHGSFMAQPWLIHGSFMAHSSGSAEGVSSMAHKNCHAPFSRRSRFALRRLTVFNILLTSSCKNSMIYHEIPPWDVEFSPILTWGGPDHPTC